MADLTGEARVRAPSGERGLSTALGYALSLSVTVLLVISLITAAGGFVSDERERAIRSEAEVVSQRIASGLMTADRLASAAGSGPVRVSATLPTTLAGKQYTIRVVANDSDSTVVVSTENPDVSVSAPFHNDTAVVTETLGGGSLRFQYKNDLLTIHDANATGISPTDEQVLAADRDVVFAQGGALKTKNASAPIRDYPIGDASATGPVRLDMDGDGDLDVPVGTASGELLVVDAAGDTETLVASGAETAKTRYAVGTWDGSDASVFYADDGGNTIHRVDGSGSSASIVSPGNGVSAVAGVADITGDGTAELVFGGGSQTVRYYETDGTLHTTGQGYGTNNGAGIGTPADFDGDGTARVPIVDGSNNLALVDSDGTKTTLVTGGVAKAPVASVDWDGDGDTEIVFVNTSGELRYLDAVTGTNDVTDVAGGSVTADAESGVA